VSYKLLKKQFFFSVTRQTAKKQMNNASSQRVLQRYRASLLPLLSSNAPPISVDLPHPGMSVGVPHKKQIGKSSGKSNVFGASAHRNGKSTTPLRTGKAPSVVKAAMKKRKPNPLKNIHIAQKATDLIIPKAAFTRMVKASLQNGFLYVLADMPTTCPFDHAPFIGKNAVNTLHEGLESYLIGTLLSDAVRYSFHAKRATTYESDVRLAHQMADKTAPPLQIDRTVTLGHPRSKSIPTHFKRGMGKECVPLQSRHRRVPNNTITKMAISKLGHRAGIRIMGSSVYFATFAALKTKMDVIIGHVFKYLMHSKKKTIQPIDIGMSLQHEGIKIYGTY
jgi:histone H3/H4